MEIEFNLGMAILVVLLLIKAFRNVLSKQPTSFHYRGRSIVAAAAAIFVLVGYFTLFDSQPTWLTTVIVLSVGGLICVAVEFWRGTWRFRPFD